MMNRRVHKDGRLVEEWDADVRPRIYREWDHETGDLTVEMTFAEKSVEDGYAEDHYDAIAGSEIAEGAQMTLLERIERIERHLWPPDDTEEPPEPSTVPTFSDYGGQWPDGKFLLDGGKVWLNRAGVPLTTPPSLFEPPLERWSHLFVEVVGEVEPEEPEEPSAPTWVVGEAVKVGDRRNYDGVIYVVITPHTTQADWAPPLVPSLWAKE